MPRLALLAVLATALAVARPAHAGGPPGTVVPEAPAPTHTEKYGDQIFLADAGWLVASALAAKANVDGADVLVLAYYVSGPLVHLAHGNDSAAAKSLAARALLPIAGGLIGMALGSSSEDSDVGSELGGMILGAAAGGVTAMVIDWTVLGRKRVADPIAEKVPQIPLALRPSVHLGKTQWTAGLSGEF